MKKTILILTLLVITIGVANAQPRTQSEKVEITDIEVERIGGNAYGGGDVWVTFNVRVDRCFSRSATMEIIPVLFNGEDEVELESIWVVPHRAAILRARCKNSLAFGTTVVRPSGEIEYMAGAPYAEWMNHSTLKFRRTTNHCNKDFVLPSSLAMWDITLAQEEVEDVEEIVVIEPKRKEVEHSDSFKSETIHLEFKVASAEVLSSFRGNDKELEKIGAMLKECTCLKSIKLWGTCSPEGSYSFNEELAKKRTQSLKEYIECKYDIDPEKIEISSTAENWCGLKSAVEGSSLFNKTEILEIIDSSMSDADKDTAMRKLSNYDELLKCYYPPLRCVVITIENQTNKK